MAVDSTTIELSRSELREVVGYAVVSARPALAIFEHERPDDRRPRAAIDAAQAFAEGAERTKALRDSLMFLKPVNLSFEEAAAVPMAAVTALQGLRHHGEVQAGQRVLINGASGGIGTFAVQIAKSCGSEVSGVTSTRNIDLVDSLGADNVVDYTTTDFFHSGQSYDLILDTIGNLSVRDLKRALAEGGKAAMGQHVPINADQSCRGLITVSWLGSVSQGDG